MKRWPLYLLLALIGFWCDQAILDWVNTPDRVVLVGAQMRQAMLSPDGKYVAGIEPTGDQCRLRIWATETGREAREPVLLPNPPASTSPISWSPKADRVAVGAAENVFLIPLKKGRVRKLQGAWLVREVRFSQSGLFSVRCNNVVFIYNERGKLAWRLDVPYLLHARLSEDGSQLAVAAFEDGIRVYNRGKRKCRLHLQPGAVSVGLQFCDQDSKLATAFRYRHNPSLDHARVYDLTDGRATGPELKVPELRGFSACDGGRRVVVRSGGCHLIDVQSGRTLQYRSQPSPWVDVLSADGQQVLSQPEGRHEVVLWKAADGRELAHLPHPERPVTFGFVGSQWVRVTGGPCAIWKL